MLDPKNNNTTITTDFSSEIIGLGTLKTVSMIIVDDYIPHRDLHQRVKSAMDAFSCPDGKVQASGMQTDQQTDRLAD